ncbi:MAG: TonB-dependent receptor domain-containing protein [Bacteroidota bacterium]
MILDKELVQSICGKLGIIILFRLMLCVFAFTLVRETALSQKSEKGSIHGIITDKDNHEPLPGANVTIKGTYYGAVTDPDGKFVINNINPASYTLEVSILGYKKAQFTDYKVKAGESLTLNVSLEQSVLSLGREVVVIGQKPMFDIEETQSLHTLNREAVKYVETQSVQNIVALQTGVTQADNEVHIRGGRTYENAYLVDGISVQDPLAGTGFGLQVSPSAIENVEVITGGYNAEYGEATSGIINIITKEGEAKYSGGITWKRDHFGFNNNSRGNTNTDLFDASLSGKEPITMIFLPTLGIQIPGEMNIFATMNANLSDDFMRWAENVVNGKDVGYVLSPQPHIISSLFSNSSWLTPRRDNNWSALGKLTYKPSPITKISYSYSASIGINQDTKSFQTTLEHVDPVPGFQYEFMKIPDSANTITDFNTQQSLGLVQTLSKQAFFELKFSRYSAHLRGDANGKSYQDYNAPRDIITLPVQYYNINRDTIGVIPGDGFYELGNPTVWRDHSLIEYAVKGDLTYNINENQKFKTGIETRFQDMQMIDILDPWYKPFGLDNDFYRVQPAVGALYAQDAITSKGLILNVGLRLDYWFPGQFVDETLSRPLDEINVSSAIRDNYFKDTYNFFGHRFKARISPRLGFSHPVSDNQTMFFSYGHFSKFPRPQFVYSKLVQSSAHSAFQTVGNPDLNPETNVSYELGLRNQISGNDILTVTAYYKDVFDYISARTIKAAGSRSATTTTYINLDYSRARGVEVEYETRFADWLHATLSGTYSITTGKSSTADELLYNLQQGLVENIRDEPASYDRPLQSSLNFNIHSGKDAPLFGFGKGVLENYNLFFRIFYESGKRYTPLIQYATDPLNGRPMYTIDYEHPYSAIADPWFYIDCNFEKYFPTYFGELTLSVEIQNLLDRKNSTIINPATGRAYEFGDPTQYPTSPTINDPLYPTVTPPLSPYPYNPARYLNPRTIRFGLGLSF